MHPVQIAPDACRPIRLAPDRNHRERATQVQGACLDRDVILAVILDDPFHMAGATIRGCARVLRRMRRVRAVNGLEHRRHVLGLEKHRMAALRLAPIVAWIGVAPALQQGVIGRGRFADERIVAPGVCAIEMVDVTRERVSKRRVMRDDAQDRNPPRPMRATRVRDNLKRVNLDRWLTPAKGQV